MSLPKKGQINQFMFPMIENDGLSVASTLTAATLAAGSRKFWGVNHNTGTLATSGTPSQTASLLRSGLFQIKMNAAECVYDRMNILFGATGCLDQDIVVDFADYDDSDIMSGILGLSAQISNFQSQFTSRVTGVVATTTELKSAVQSVMSSPLSDIHSGVTAGRSVASDTYSLVLALSAQISDIYSAVQAVGSTSDIRSRLSDIQSYLVGMSGMLSDIHSGVTAGRSIASDVQSYLVGLSAEISNIYSAVQAVGSTSDLRSRLSDIQSYLAGMSAMLSNVYSAIGDVSVALTDSQISNLASQVAAAVGFTPEEIASAVSTVLQPGFDTVDDTYSFLTSNRAEPGQGAPAATTDAFTKVDYLYKAWRNKATQTSTKYRLFNDNETTVGQSAVVSDDGTTFTRGEIGTGA